MNEFERRLYDCIVEDGGACPPFFLQTVLGIGDFDTLVEALNGLVAMGAVKNGPQGYRACTGWQEDSRVDCVAGSSDAHVSYDDGMGPQADFWPRRCANYENGEGSGDSNAADNLEPRSDVDDESWSAAVAGELVSTDSHGCFDGMSDQAIERTFQDLFQELGLQASQTVYPGQTGFGEGPAEALFNDVATSVVASTASKECDMCEPAEYGQEHIAFYGDALDEGGLPTRAVSALAQLNIVTVEQLCCFSTLTQFQDIGQIPRLGCKTKEDTYAWLDAHACHISYETFDHLSQFERELCSETDYFINRLGLLCTFDCANGGGTEPVHKVQSSDKLMHLPLSSLEIPGFTKAMVGSLGRHGVRAVEDLLAMDTERVLCYRGWGSTKKRKLDLLVAQLRALLEAGGCSELSFSLQENPKPAPRLAFSPGSESLLEEAQLLAQGLGELGYFLYMPTAIPWLNACAEEGLGLHEAAVRLIGQEPTPEATEYLVNILRRRVDEAVDEFRQGNTDVCSALVPDAPGWDAAARECCDEDESLSYDERARLLTKRALMLEEWVSSIESDVKRTILIMRLAGSTLQETADAVGLTRERVRQIEAKLLEASPLLYILKFRRLVDSYEVSETQFVDMGLGSSSEYRYLDKTVRRKGGRLPLARAMHDSIISEVIKSKLAAYINKERSKYYVQVEDGSVRIDKTEIAQYLLRKAAEEGRPSLSSDELLRKYRNFCEQHELEGRKGIDPGNARTLLTYLQRKDAVLAPSGQSIRLYDFNAYDFSDLEAALDLMSKETIECSARILGRRFPGLLDEYDLLDEYELHFVIRRLNFDKLIGFELGRSPMIKFGNADREEQIKSLIREKGAISVDDLSIAYEKKYGVSEDSFKASFLNHMSQYKHGHVYSMSEESLTNREKRWLESELEGVSYIPLEFIRQRFIDEFSLEAAQKICDRNLSSLGFEVSEDLIVSRSIDIDAAFSKLLDGLTFTFEGEEGLSADVMNHSLFRSRLDSRLRQFRLIKFDHGEDGRTVFVSEKYLNELFSVDADLMRSYVRHVIEYVGREKPFTIKSLRDGGFVHSLDLIRGDVRFGDSFFENVLSAGIGDLRIGTSSCRGVRIFCLTDSPFSSVSLFEHLVAREGAVELDELQGILHDEFGIEAGLTYMRSVVARSHIVSRLGDMLFASDEAYAEFRDALIAAL